MDKDKKNNVDRIKEANKPKEIIFWKISSKANKSGKGVVYFLKIDKLKFAKLLELKGFNRIYMGKIPMYVWIENMIADDVTKHFIRDYVKEYVRSLPEILEEKKDSKGELIYKFLNSDLEATLLNANNIYFGEAVLTWIDKTDLKIKRDEIDAAFYYFRNCFVRVSKDEIQTFDYSELKEPIWKKQIIGRDFNPTEIIKYEDGEFYRFAWNVCNHDIKRFCSLLSMLGYLIHSYKDKSNVKMIVFVDEKISKKDEANGGTGKSLLAEATKRFKNVCYKGKGWSPVKNFAFENVLLDTDILLIDDAFQKFPFEMLFTHITDDFAVEGKNDKSYSIPFVTSPKIFLTTNYSLMGEGNSYDRRKAVFECSDYYGSERTPKSEFGHNLFDHWDENEWQAFDRFMFYAVQYFLTNGLNEELLNYSERELLQLVPEQFIDFMDTLELNKNYLANELMQKFIKENSSNLTLTQNSFNKWIRKYVQVKKIITEGSQGKNESAPFTKREGKMYLKLVERPISSSNT